jgi:pilus assembly protein CpaF
MSERLVVRVEAPGGKVRRAAFVPGFAVWLGRDDDCQFVLRSPNVSRKHVSLTLEGNVIVVQDCSANGTRVAERLLRESTLRLSERRAVLEVGPYQVSLERRVAEPDAAQLQAHSSSLAPAIGSVAAVLRRHIHAQLLDHLELDRIKPGTVPDAALRERVRVALEGIVLAHSREIPSQAQRAELVCALVDEALGLGPLEQLLADPAVSEIMVVDPRTIYAEKNGRLALTELSFSDDEAVRAAIERIVTPLGRRIDESNPLVDARLRDGSRVNAVIPPLATRGPCITIRKFPAKSLTVTDLVELGSLSERMARLLTRSVAARKNVVISGGTGSGKTTLLNVLSSAIPAHERVVTIEDAAELRLAQPHVVSLEARPPNLEGKGEFTIRDLVKNALRMRPDRIVVGECRGGEALDMLQAMNTGHEGSMTTTHANSPREAVSRIETLCLMAGLDLPTSAIRRQIASSVHLVVQQSRLSDGSRKVTSITEVVGLSPEGEVELQELFSFERLSTEEGRVRGEFRPSGRIPTYAEELISSGLATQGDIL